MTMSKYTTELRYIPKADIFDFDFTMYGVDETAQTLHKQSFIDRFYKYYYFDEINGDTLNEFNRWLEKVMNEYLPLFNNLYAKQEGLMSGDLLNKVRTLSRTTKVVVDDDTTGSNTYSSKFLDTPNTPYGTTEDQYATNITNDNGSSESHRDSTNEGTEGISETETKELPLEIWRQYYEYYKDLDMELIEKFKECFMLIY